MYRMTTIPDAPSPPATSDPDVFETHPDPPPPLPVLVVAFSPLVTPLVPDPPGFPTKSVHPPPLERDDGEAA
jgi:hypothetical protein